MPTPYQLDLFNYLKNYFGLTVVYFTEREKDRLWNLEDRGLGYDVIYLQDNIIAKVAQSVVTSFHYSSEIKYLSKTLKADMVIVNGTYWSPNVQTAIAYSKLNKALTVFWGEPIFQTDSSILRFIKSLFIRRLFAKIDLLFAIGNRAVQSYRNYGFKKQILNIPYSVDPTLFAPQTLNRTVSDELIKKYKQNAEVVLLSSGSLIERKGMDTLIKAFKMSDALNAKLLIIGDGPEKEELRLLVANDRRIELLGFQDKKMIPSLFLLADIFIFASRYDGWGLVVNEAMHAGCAIIASKETGAAADMLKDGENGILCDAEAVDQFARAITKLVSNESLRVKLGLAAKRSAEDISSQRIAERIYGVYNLGE